MLAPIFSEKFPFVYNYFNSLFELIKENKRNFPQAIIFEGIDTKLQYLFSLELARILNCSKNKELNCDCTNCRWIKEHKHPAVNNVSQIHFKGEDDETKTIISAKQAKKIEQNIVLSSDYWRFFIFFSSQENSNPEEIKEFNLLNYDGKIDFTIEPLNYKTFHPTTPNALLKSIEEPPAKTTFVFLTKSKEDILPTIVSRCLVFKMNSQKNSLNYDDISFFTSEYQKISYSNVFNLVDNIINYTKEQQISIEIFLNKFLEFLKDLLINNINNITIYQKIQNDINIANHTIKQAKANISEKNIIEAMLLKIIRGY